ncbi:NEDD8 ultimate buster 1 [Danio rerio]|uniref:NEDD8 ultimate buster 1 n=1 Tax=Danio rerio TaxID=7955 RepID=A0A8M3AW93_DANRE|nr:NEDD8 ultimate buster 1 isoform X2 [Danio rerio]|eukprot:XP_009295948.1 NEDD8 ultimate buster 1 isoform X2 [Danio rerio]
MMEEQHLQARLIALLRQDKIQLWLEPYRSLRDPADRLKIQELAEKYASVIQFPVEEVTSALESIRTDTSRKDEGNKEFKETAVATLVLHLPREEGETKIKKVELKTKLDITTQELKKQISQEFGFTHFNLICGKVLSPERRLDEQKVKNNSKIMVVKGAPPDAKAEMYKNEEEKRKQDEEIKKTQKGFQILSERDGSEDPSTTPFLEIADQKGNPLQIPDEERKALILAMGFHEKGRALMKKRDHSAALPYLVLADEQFKKCNSAILHTVDNYAVLQLDVVWCYQALGQLECLDNARQRLEKAEQCFQKCYGEKQSRLQQIKGHTGGEEVLFLRLRILQTLLTYIEGHKNQALGKLKDVEHLYGELSLDPQKLQQLKELGFSEQEARLGLRACRGDVSEAALLITQRKKEKQVLKLKEQDKRRRRLQDINTLVELGFERRDAQRALHQARGDVDKAYGILLDGADAQKSDRDKKLNELLSMGFQEDMADSALRMTGDDVQQATQLLLENQAVIPADLQSPSPPSSSSEEPSTSSESTGSSRQDEDLLVNELLEDIPKHEEDYLDLTLEEEKELMDKIRTILEK